MQILFLAPNTLADSSQMMTMDSNILPSMLGSFSKETLDYLDKEFSKNKLVITNN